MGKHQNDKLKNTIEESVVMSMDGADSQLFPFLPYILQDIWEIGASPNAMLQLVRKFGTDHSNLKILDLGCGKGPVSIRLAKELNCHCHGIDAVEEFVDEAIKKARESHVEKNCRFECDDIRVRISKLRDYDIIILGGIGPVLGDSFSTLTKISKCLKDSGFIIIDDGYIDDDSPYSHPLLEKRSAMLKKISDAGMKLINERIIDKEELKITDEFIYNNIKRRCQELIEKHPDQKEIFTDYIRKQEEEIEMLETKIICSTMVLEKGS